jgi:UDP-N-acetylglucosamine 2-epimerase
MALPAFQLQLADAKASAVGGTASMAVDLAVLLLKAAPVLVHAAAVAALAAAAAAAAAAVAVVNVERGDLLKVCCDQDAGCHRFLMNPTPDRV